MNNEIIIVNKEKGLTSRDVVNKLSKILNTKKVGHTGTLDPIAEGVLVCLTNKYTKLQDLIMSEDKEYIATIKLGIKTDTLDITGNIIDENYNYNLDKNKVYDVLNSFKGEMEQIVPAYSAVSINGKRLYEYARNNEVIELPKRKVIIKEISLINFDNDRIKFKCLVSKGTYIRSLISDICDKLGVYGTMSELVRTKQGKFSINNSYRISDIENGKYKSLSLNEIFDLTEVYLDDSLLSSVVNGNKLNLEYNGYVLFKREKDIALYNFENNIGRLIIMF